MQTADLSVIISNYNHARYLPKAVDSVLAQAVRPREIVLIDDASTTDDSVEVMEGYARREPSVRFVRNEQNLGVLRSYNKGVGLATSTYVLLAAADDYLVPGFVEKLMAPLAQHPRAGLCFAYDSYRVGEDGPLEENPSGWPGAPRYYTPDEVARYLRHGIPGHAVIARRDALIEVGGYLHELSWYSDWFAFLAVALRQGACHIPETLAVRVLLPTAFSSEARQGDKHVAVLGAFFDRIVSPEYADLGPYLRRNGALTYFGTDIVRAAAKRPDRWNMDILGFLNGFTREQYEGLADDPDPAVRELALFFLGPFWKREQEKRLQRENEIIHLANRLTQARAEIPPPGVAGKLKWYAGRAKRRLVG
jgi:glycosyltransferase involved in cell wall biosynthesis